VAPLYAVETLPEPAPINTPTPLPASALPPPTAAGTLDIDQLFRHQR
jgi:hypothetical protein